MGQFISIKSEINNPWFNPWFILLHTHSNVCATVEGRCLEHLVCITLTVTHDISLKVWLSRMQLVFICNFKLHQLLKPFNTGHKTTTMAVEKHGSMRLCSLRVNFDGKFQFKWVFLIKMQLYLILQLLARSNYTVR